MDENDYRTRREDAVERNNYRKLIKYIEDNVHKNRDWVSE